MSGGEDLLPLERESWDVVVVGAGPAGSMSALEAARSGSSVLLVDRTTFPRSKVCGCCLNMIALRVLQDAGIFPTVLRLGAPELREFRVTFHGREFSIGLPGGLAISREVFDQALVECACQRGAHFLSGVRASLGELRPDGCCVDLVSRSETQRVRASVVLCADGLNGSFLKNYPEYASRISPSSRVGLSGFISENSGRQLSGAIGMMIGTRGYVGTVEVEAGRLNVAAAVDIEALRQANHSPHGAIREIFEEAGGYCPLNLSQVEWKGTPPLTRKRRVVGNGRLLILGDAAGYVEPFTGEGMAWAMASARILAPLLRNLAKNPTLDLGREWQQLYDRTIRKRQRICRVLGRLIRSQGLMRCAAPVSQWMRFVVTFLNRPIPQEPSFYES